MPYETHAFNLLLTTKLCLYWYLPCYENDNKNAPRDKNGSHFISQANNDDMNFSFSRIKHK